MSSVIGRRVCRPGKPVADLASFYPGDAYVDWTGLDGYNWGTNPAKPDRWRSFDQLYKLDLRKDRRHDRPLEADDDQRGRLDRVRRLEGGLDQGHAGQDPRQLPEDPRPALVREVRRRHGLAARDLGQRHQRLRAGIQNPAYAVNTFGSLGLRGPILPPAEPQRIRQAPWTNVQPGLQR